MSSTSTRRSTGPRPGNSARTREHRGWWHERGCSCPGWGNQRPGRQHPASDVPRGGLVKFVRNLGRPTSGASSDSVSDSVSDPVSDSDSDSDSVSVSLLSENAAAWAEAEVGPFVAAAPVAAGCAEGCPLTFSCWMPVVTVFVLPSSLASCRQYFKSTQWKTIYRGDSESC